MAIDAAEKAMMVPTSDGGSVGNFNIGPSFSYKANGNFAVNRQEAVRAVGNATIINQLLGKVSFKACNQQQLPPLAGGSALGKPLGSDGMAN